MIQFNGMISRPMAGQGARGTGVAGRHAYVLAASNLHVLLDDYPLPTPRPAQDDFRSLIGDR